MDHLQQLVRQIRRHLLLVILVENAVIVASWYLLTSFTDFSQILVTGIVAGLAIILTIMVAYSSSNYVIQPTKALWQAVLHISPDKHEVVAPDTTKLKVGHELVASLTSEIYQFATQAESINDTKAHQPNTAESILKTLPLPIVVLGKDQSITFVNEVAAKYINSNVADMVGRNFYSLFDLMFSSNQTLDSWLTTVGESSLLASQTWNRVRLKLGDTSHQFDLAAYFSKDNPSGAEITLALFDHSDSYGQDDQAASLVALSVHELRTPLTLLRGYIEVFDDELKDKLEPELVDFMDKMKAAAEQLSVFVSNILNVARIDSDQMSVNLQEENWAEVLDAAVKNMELRAKVHGIEISCETAGDLPTVGVDRVSIYEVINNLVDNAIKYSGSGKKIVVKSGLNKENLIETTVEDNGVGIAPSVIPHIFDKYYRNFHNQSQVKGTGLGLYLCRAIVTAHGGNIWVRSNEGHGSVFGFTLLPYTQLADEQKNGDNKDIVRGAHGWIKNHSLYRN